jgi:hypothetical protein
MLPSRPSTFSSPDELEKIEQLARVANGKSRAAQGKRTDSKARFMVVSSGWGQRTGSAESRGGEGRNRIPQQSEKRFF